MNQTVTTTMTRAFQASPIKSDHFYIGLTLALTSTIFIGSSFIIKKKALIHLNRSGALRAGSGGFGYLREWLWWLGLITMGIGECSNFAAYAFAPASLVTPLGALSVLVSAVLSSKYLNERLNLLGQIGCLLCILGSTIIVIHSPKEEEVESLDVLLVKLRNPLFVTYVTLVILVSFLIIFHYGPRYGSRHVLVYILLCSSIGSLTVMSCKALGLAIQETVRGGDPNDLRNWLTYAFLTTVIVCIVTQMNYLNKALDLFNANVVTPVYYVVFTTLVIVASAILFSEWSRLDAEDLLGNVCGFAIVVIAIFLLSGFKDVDIYLKDMKSLCRPKYEPIGYERSRGAYGSVLRSV